MPLHKELLVDSDSSSDESLFSFLTEQLKGSSPLIQDPTEARGIIANAPLLLTPEHFAPPETSQPIIEEFNEPNNESYLILDSSSEEDDNDLFLSDSDRTE